VNFEWDSRKAAQNRRKHGISFYEGTTVFGDPLAVTHFDPDHSISEQRFITVGLSSAQRVPLVVHTAPGENIRIIGVRKAMPSEQRQYEEKN
jgi:hypothetical protein